MIRGSQHSSPRGNVPMRGIAYGKVTGSSFHNVGTMVNFHKRQRTQETMINTICNCQFDIHDSAENFTRDIWPMISSTVSDSMLSTGYECSGGGKWRLKESMPSKW
jgi:hypothetical protein